MLPMGWQHAHANRASCKAILTTAISLGLQISQGITRSRMVEATHGDNLTVGDPPPQLQVMALVRWVPCSLT